MLDYSYYLEIKDSKEKGRGVFTKKRIENGETVMVFERPIFRTNQLAKSTAIQIDIDTYLDSESFEIRDLLNHSCDPNCKIDIETMTLIAIRDILSSEELTFSYCTTEFDLAAKNESFECHCGSSLCTRIIKGFNHLSLQQKTKLNSMLLPYLKNLAQS